MANYANLKAAVNAAITTNGNNEITGAILNDILNSIISTIGGNYTFAGVVTPSTTISAPDANVFWIGGAGTYTQFGGTITIADGNIGVFTYNGSYTRNEIVVAPNSVKTVQQTLTGAQQLIACRNIGLDSVFVDPSLFTAGIHVSVLGRFVPDSNASSTSYILIDTEEDISISGFGAYTSISSLTFYDKDFVLVESNVATASKTYTKDQIPAGAKYVVLSTLTSNLPNCQFKNGGIMRFVTTINNMRIDNNEVGVSEVRSYYRFVQGGYRDYKYGHYIDSTDQNYLCTDIIPINKNYTHIHIKNNYAAGGTNYSVLFFDKGLRVLRSISRTGAQDIDLDITTSEYQDAVFFCVNHYNQALEHVVYCYKAGALSETIEDIQVGFSTFSTLSGLITQNLEQNVPLSDSRNGYYQYSNGLWVNSSSARSSELTPIIKGYKYLEYWTNLANIGASIAFFDINKQYIQSLSIQGQPSYGSIVDISGEEYNSAYYVVICCFGPANYDRVFCRLYNQDSISQRIQGIEDSMTLLPQKTSLSRVLIFGDSITDSATITIANDKTTSYVNRETSYYVVDGQTIYYSFWPYLLSRYFSISDMRNYAKSGASYRDRNPTAGNERQDLSYQITVALNDANNPNNVFPTQGEFYPDIIIFALGTNDGAPNDTYESAMAKTVRDADNNYDIPATLANLDRTKFCEAARWAYLTIRNRWPLAQCFCVLPIQCAASEITFAYGELQKMAERYGIIVLNGATSTGIIQDLEIRSGLGFFLKDGLHPNGKGQNLLARLIINGIKNNYIQKDYFNAENV